MGQEHMKGDAPPAWIVAGEFRQDLCQFPLQLENPTLIKGHAGCGGGDDLSERGQVVYRFRGDRWRALVIGKPSHALKSNEFASVGDSERGPGESFLINTGSQHLKGARELLVLVGKILGKHGG